MNKSKRGKTTNGEQTKDMPKQEEKGVFNSIRMLIERFELNDRCNPAYYVIGFRIQNIINQQQKYVETTVEFETCKDLSDNEVCHLAYKQLKDKITQITSELQLAKSVIGSEFVPSDDN